MAEEKRWLIWSNEHSMWWKPNHRGYTAEPKEAGLYTFDEALAICKGANMHQPSHEFPNETMVREDCHGKSS
jgi:hypothetical protein